MRVPEPSQHLNNMYREIFTEVGPDGVPKDPNSTEGVALTPREQLRAVMELAQLGMTRSKVTEGLFGERVDGTFGSVYFGVRGTPRRPPASMLEAELVDNYVAQLVKETGVTLGEEER
jgi:hypothetical protein